MARPLTFVVYAGHTTVKARLVKCMSKEELDRHECPYCECPTNMTYLAFTAQYGFYHDLLHYVYNCEQCQHNAAYQYEKKLTEASAIDRLRSEQRKD
jgi:C4-type Zn-finger protein